MVAMPPLHPRNIDGPRVIAPAQEQAVGVHDGLMVHAHDGSELGRVGEFIIDPDGNLTSFIVRTSDPGSETRVWMSWIHTWIHTVTRERIVLRLTAAEVRAANQAARKAVVRKREHLNGR